MNNQMLNAIFIMVLSLVKSVQREWLYEVENKVCVTCKKVIRKEIERDICLKKLNQTNSLYIQSIKKALDLTDVDIPDKYIEDSAKFLDIEIKQWSIWDYFPLKYFKRQK